LAPHRAPQRTAVQQPAPRGHPAAAALEPFGVVELGCVVGHPGEVAAPDVGQQQPVLWVALGDVVAERAQQLGGLLYRRPCQCSGSGSVDRRPRIGLSPNSPHSADGTRIEAPPSEPSPTGAKPAATAAAVPPLEPPVARLVSHGLRVAPWVCDSVMWPHI